MTAGGFIRISREAIETIGADPITLAVYIAICARARWEGPSTVTTSHGVIELRLGQCVLGRGELAGEVGTSEQKIRTALTRLVKHGIATIESTKRGTIATVGPRKVKAPETHADQPSRPPSSNQASTTTYTEDLRSSFSDPASGPPGDPGSARLGPIRGTHADPAAVEEYERIRKLGGWGAVAMPGMRLLEGGDK